MNTPNEIEQEIQAKGLTAPRVTPQMIEDAIASEAYINAQEAIEETDPHHSLAWDENSPLHRLTICFLVLKNGFVVTGESASVSAENFDAEIGRKAARQNAVDKIWPLEGYLLKEKMAFVGVAGRV
jgi:hypothetical protein